MEFLKYFTELDQQLVEHAAAWGPWIYAILFAVIFCETGLVVTPFLPGDSLLFAAGALAALDPPPLQLAILMPLLLIAAVAGDAVNYAIGRAVGPRVFRGEKSRLLNRKHLLTAQRFYDQYGGKTIIIARFVPIVRTFAPVIAGVGKMNYGYFWLYNVVGALAWVVVCTMAGYAFGNLPVVKDKFELVVLGIIAVSVLPMFWDFFRHAWLAPRKRETPAAPDSGDGPA